MTPRPAAPADRAAYPIATVALPVLIAGTVALVALGFLVGAGGSFLQARTVRLGLRWPVGSLLALLVLGALGLSAGLVARSRIGLALVGAGWVVSVFIFTAGRPEGDVVIGANLPGYLFLLGGVSVLGVLFAVPFAALPASPPRPAAAAADPPSP
ncbi:MAG TPA: DUF6113 family protein [Sporichthya sp.]|nr:DUF6113 family protein [Sporichthya sp.]